MKKVTMIMITMMMLAATLITGCNGKRLDSLEVRLNAYENQLQTTGQAVIQNANRLDGIYKAGSNSGPDSGLLVQLVSATADISAEVTNLRDRVDGLEKLDVQKQLNRLAGRTESNRSVTAENRALINFGSATKMTSIFFQTGSSCPSEQAVAMIKKMVEAGEMELAEAVIVGYADKTGNPEKNQELSLARAEAVKKALADAGVNVSKVRVQAVGGTNDFSFGAERNRRAVIYAQPKVPALAQAQTPTQAALQAVAPLLTQPQAPVAAAPPASPPPAQTQAPAAVPPAQAPASGTNPPTQ